MHAHDDTAQPHAHSYPVPQRRLRPAHAGNPVRRLTDRAASSGEHLAFLARHLTPRDRWLARLALEYRVLTTTQLIQLAFPSPRTATLRLHKLYEWRILDRFRPLLAVGSAPMHYVLDVAGAAVLAAEDGLEIEQLGYRHDRALAIGHSLRLVHTVGVTGLYTALVAVARHTNPHEAGSGSETGMRAVTAWWPETRCAQLWGDLARPDAYGRWREDGHEVEFFLEYDTGTEPLTRVAGKLHDYHRLAAATGITTPVLFWFRTAERETHARQALAATHAQLTSSEAVPIATTSATNPATGGSSDSPATGVPPDSPAAARWLPLTGNANSADGSRRVRLAGLRWPDTAPNHATPQPETASPSGRTRTAGWTPPPPMPPDADGRYA